MNTITNDTYASVLLDLWELSPQVNFSNNSDNITVSFDYQRFLKFIDNEVIIQLFDNTSNPIIDGNEYSLKNLPEQGLRIVLLVDEDKWIRNGFSFCKDENDECQKIWLSSQTSVADYSFRHYIIHNKIEKWPKLCDKGNKTVDALRLFEKLKDISDFQPSSNSILFLDKAVLEIQKSPGLMFTGNQKSLETFVTEDFNNNKTNFVLFKSVLYNKLVNFPPQDRFEKLLVNFDQVMQEYKITCGNYYEKYSLHQLQIQLNEAWILLNDKIKESLKDVKEGIILLLSTLVAFSQFDFSWQTEIIKNIAVLLFLIAATVIYVWILIQSIKRTKHMNVMVVQEELRLKQIRGEEKTNNDEIIDSEMNDIRNSISSTIKMLKACIIISLILVCSIPILSVIYNSFPASNDFFIYHFI